MGLLVFAGDSGRLTLPVAGKTYLFRRVPYYDFYIQFLKKVGFGGQR